MVTRVYDGPPRSSEAHPAPARRMVGRDAEAKAPGIEPTTVVPWRWVRRTVHVAAALAVLMLGSLFLPTFDPFGKVAAAKEAALRQQELVKNRKATEIRKTELAKSDLEALWDGEWRAHWLEIAGDRVRQQVDPEQYQMFELHVMRGNRFAKSRGSSA